MNERKRRASRKSGGARQSTKALPKLNASPHAPSILNSRYHFFGGKGGVGKTTAATATALYLLDNSKQDGHVLLFSTDPAHSLSDSLEIEIGDKLTEITRRADSSLYAYEMDAGAALYKFKEKHRAVLAEIAERGTLLDESDVNELLNLSLPGMDEVMALFELSELSRAGTYSHIIVDTAPSGHTSRLLKLPAVFAQMLTALDRMSDKHRYIIAQFARGATRTRMDKVELFLRDMNERVSRVRSMLFGAGETSFTLVTIPEAMAVEETARYFALLKDEGVPMRHLIVNRVEHEHDDCPYCAARVRSQQPHLTEIEREFSGLQIHQVPLLAEEVRGIKRLKSFARLVWEDEGDTETRRRGDAERKNTSVGASLRSSATASSKLSVAVSLRPRLSETHAASFPFDSRRLLIFGGKGGVGKTTAAASAALALADGNTASRVLIFSTDPAHSLSDSFDEEIGALKENVAGRANLDAMEIDPGRRFEELKERYRAWIDELFETLTGASRWEVQFDREAMRELVSLAPPGIDEIAALSAISDLLDENRYATIVLDTAPTGHLIRFLELPDVALSWVRTFIKLLLKYKNVVRARGVAEELIALSKSIKRVIALLTDAQGCEFVGVSIPERMSLEETVRLTRTLERLKVPMRRLVVNMIVPEEAAATCDFCRARRDAQGITLEDFRREFKGTCELFTAPQQPHEIRGAEKLLEHFARWRKFGEEQDSRAAQRTTKTRKNRARAVKAKSKA